MKRLIYILLAALLTSCALEGVNGDGIVTGITNEYGVCWCHVTFKVKSGTDYDIRYQDIACACNTDVGTVVKVDFTQQLPEVEPEKKDTCCTERKVNYD